MKTNTLSSTTKKKMYKKFIGSLLLSLTILPVAAYANVYEVFSPSSSIQTAINKASNGDTINVAPGVYNENIDFQGKSIGLFSLDGASQTTIMGTGGTTVNIGGSDTIEGFTISSGTAAFGAGMSVSGTGARILNNIFQSNNEGSGGYGAAIGGNSASPIISGNIFTHNSADGQFLSGVVSFINSSSPIITNNLFYQNDARAINFTTPDDARPIVANNTIVSNTTGIYIDGRIGFSPEVFANNIIFHNTIGIESPFANGIDPAIISNNLIADNTTNFSGVLNLIGLAGNITGNPDFLNAPNNDYRIGANSSALGAGSPIYSPSFDIAGNERSAISPSIGAYELSSVPEPSSISLLSAGLLGGVINSLKKKQKLKNLLASVARK